MLEVFDGRSVSGRLIYRHSEFCVFTDPQPAGGKASLLVNDVQLELDRNGQLLYVWGYCPEASWKRKKLNAPEAREACLRWIGEPIHAGTSMRLNELARWEPSYDPESSWLKIGSSKHAQTCVYFGPGAVAELTDSIMTALWLRIDEFQ